MRHVWRASGPHLYQKELVCHSSHASISSLDTRRSLVRRVSRRHVPRVACARVGREHRRVAHDLHEAIPSWPIRLKLHLGHLARGVGRAPRHLPRSPDLACGGTSAPAHLAHLGWLPHSREAHAVPTDGCCWRYERASEPAETLLHVTGPERGVCACIGRPHASRHIMVTLDLQNGLAWQRCWDQQCRRETGGGGYIKARHALGLLPDGLELAAAHRLLGWVCDLQHPRSRLNARCSLMSLHMIVFTTVGIGR